MIPRHLSTYLQEWKHRIDRKPLIVRGARQVGKTTLIKSFAQGFAQYLPLNLEIPTHRAPFEEINEIEVLVQRLFIEAGLRVDILPTLVFIDEIQTSPNAIRLLRFFYEKYPQLHVIGAGSLLEHALSKVQSFPVGRVEYVVLHPVNFSEFLSGMKEDILHEVFMQIPVPAFAHERLKHLFHQYAIIGGLPEIVQRYSTTHDVTQLMPIYESIYTGYKDDAAKYARSKEEERMILHVMDSAPGASGTRIKFAGFGASVYRSREMGEVLRTIEKARLLQLIYPTTMTVPPPLPDKRKSPRLQFLDTGLVNYALGLQSQMIGIDDLNHIHKGRIIEQLVLQEFLSIHHQPSFELTFWVRQKPTSVAETDCLVTHGQYMIPVEIKASTLGHLRSLNEFINACPHHYAIRIHGGEFSVHEAATSSGKKFFLMNLPYYLGTRIPQFAQWFVQNYPEMDLSK